MGSFGDHLSQRSAMLARHDRACPGCAGRGFNGRPAGGVPGGAVLMAKVQCGTCTGTGRVLVAEESREGGVTTVRLYGPDGRLVDKLRV